MTRNKSFNDNAYVRSRYKAYNPAGEFVEVVALSYDAKRRYEAKGWTFVRTTMREGDHLGSGTRRQ